MPTQPHTMAVVGLPVGERAPQADTERPSLSSQDPPHAALHNPPGLALHVLGDKDRAALGPS